MADGFRGFVLVYDGCRGIFREDELERHYIILELYLYVYYFDAVSLLKERYYKI